MTEINKYIVRIITSGGSSTGFIYFPPGDKELVYVVTVKHIFQDLNGILSRENVQVQFFDEDKKLHEIIPGDVILFGANNDIEDFAIIVLPIRIVPLSIDPKQSPGVFKFTGVEKECLITGFPKVVNNELQRTLHDVQLLRDKDHEHQLQLEISDPLSDHYNSDSLFDGFSGSPIFIESQSKYYLGGIFLAYEMHTKRVLGIDLSIINKTLINLNMPTLQLQEVETNKVILNDLTKIRANSIRVLNRINDKVGNTSILRTNLENQVRDIISLNPFTLISGKAGIGKSALAKKVIVDLESDYETIVLQGEQLDKSSVNEIFKESSFALDESFEELLNSVGMKTNKILLVDSIEKLLETTNADTIIDFFGILTNRTDLKVIFTCRSYATEHLKLRFLQKFTSFGAFEVPLLTNEELKVISNDYPSIKPLLNNESLKKVLQIPFNLDKAILVGSALVKERLGSEIDFKRLVWEYIIENKEKDPDPVSRSRRSEIFQSIALLRAIRMTPYVPLEPNMERLIVYKLVADNLLEESLVSHDQFSSTHDIYEDWALTRHIELEYDNTIAVGEPASSFYLILSFAPAVRRAFRIWISEKIQAPDFTMQEFIQNTLKDSLISPYWKDEIIIAIMQSAYSGRFLEENKAILFASEFLLFNRSLLLLMVGCQVPDFSNLMYLNEEDKIHIYGNNFLKPIGIGWASMVNFVYSEFDQLINQTDVIIPMLLQWGKILQANLPLPSESKNAGQIILRLLENYRKKLESGESEKLGHVSEMIALLFKLTSVMKAEISLLIITALNIEDNDTHYRLKNFLDKILEKVLSWNDSIEISRDIPEIVIQVAEKEWYYYPLTEEEVAEIVKDLPFKSLPRGIEKNEQFGIISEFNRDYFPASVYQTMVRNLLHHAPIQAIQFIIRLMNHSAKALWESDFMLDPVIMQPDQRLEIEYSLPDGTKIRQYGCLTLWVMYRGTYIATPYLLQSVLMALEAWLLYLGNIVEKDEENKYPWVRTQMDSALDQLMIDSKSVATTAVLISFSLAHPKLAMPKILPLLKVKEFYAWDLLRKFHESRSLAPIGSGVNGQLQQRERVTSNKLPHRQKHMETLILNLSLGAYSDQILNILDSFYAENSNDESWKFTLNRMDRRKLEIIDEVENGFVVQTKLDAELIPTAEKTRMKIAEISPLTEATNWSNKKLKNEPVENSKFDEWQRHFEILSKFKSTLKDAALYYNPALLAAVGIRDYFDNLNPDQLEWCCLKVFSIVEFELNKGKHPRNPTLESSFGAFETDAAFISLVDLVNNAKGDVRIKAKNMLFYCLLFIHHEIEKEDLIAKIKTSLWSYSPKFALSCVSGLIAYSKIADRGFRIIHTQPIYRSPVVKTKPHRNSWFGKIIVDKFLNLVHLKKSNPTVVDDHEKEFLIMKQSYEKELDAICKAVVNETLKLDQSFPTEKESSTYFLMEALFIIPENTVDEDLQSYFTTILNFIFSHFDSEDKFGNEKIPFDYLQKFEKSFSKFLLTQTAEISLSKFKELIDAIFDINAIYDGKKREFVGGCLEMILSMTIENDAFIANFWILWNYLSSKILNSKISYFGEIILLDYKFWGNNSNKWAAITKKKYFFELLIPKINSLKSTAKLLSGVGYTELLPDGITWLSDFLKEKPFLEKYELFYLEKLAIAIFYDKNMRNIVRNNNTLRNSFILILDVLINMSSASAFLIREDFISLNK